MNCKKVLIFIDWFLPGYKAGGPIQSIANFVTHFGNELEISIVTSNKDLGDVEPYNNLKFNKWNHKGNYRIIYLDKEHQNISYFNFLLNEKLYDTVYFNSLFSVYYTLLPLLVAIKNKKRIVIAPRGMLGAGALNIKKTKKQLLLRVLKLSGIPKRISWQATAESEVEEVKKCFGANTNVFLAPNLSAKMKSEIVGKTKLKGKLNLFFLSRIALKKNLKAALQYLMEVSNEYKIRFAIIGPIDEIEYWKECEQLIKKMPNHITVNYIGAIPNLELPEILKEEHVMLLPTFHENFGHVIMESFQNGCPVIISDQTPWSNLENKRMGWDINLNEPKKFIKAIETMAKMNNLAYNEWSLNAFNFAKEKSNNETIIKAYGALFN